MYFYESIKNNDKCGRRRAVIFYASHIQRQGNSRDINTKAESSSVFIGMAWVELRANYSFAFY